MSSISGLQDSSLSSLYSAILSGASGSSGSKDSSLDPVYSAILAKETGSSGSEDATDLESKLTGSKTPVTPMQLLNSYMVDYYESSSGSSGVDLSSVIMGSIQARLQASSSSGTGGKLDVTA